MSSLGGMLRRMGAAVGAGHPTRKLRYSTRRQFRAAGRGPSPVEHRLAGIEPLESRLLLSISSPFTWVAEGPAAIEDGQVEGMEAQDNPVIGALHTLVAHPTDPDILYAGSVNGGVWKTSNATDSDPTWTPLTDFEDSLSIGALQFDPTDATYQTLIAGMGRFSSLGLTGGVRTGLLRTTDGGATWTPLGESDLFGRNISGLAARGATIVASANQFGAGGGLYRSTDTGGSFSLISGAGSGLPIGAVSDLVADPDDPDRLYAAIVPKYNPFGGIDTLGGVFRSDDFGANWTDVTSTLTFSINALAELDPETGLYTGTNNVELAVHSNAGAGTNAVYVGSIYVGQLDRVFRSDDMGSSWTSMDVLETDEGAEAYGLQPRQNPSAQGAIHFSILADPNDENVVYVGGDRQPRFNETPSNGGTWPNTVGAFDFSGRLFRGDVSAAAGRQWTPLSHVGAASTAAALRDVEGATNGAPIVVTATDHDLSDDDLVYIFDVEGNIAANGLWSITVQDVDHFRLGLVDGFTPSDGSASGAYVGGTGRWYVYKEAGSDQYLGSAPHADSREMTFDALGRLVEVDDGGIYRRTNPDSLFGTWTSLGGNLQVTEFHSAAWDGNTHTVIGGTQDVGTPQQTSQGNTTWSDVSTGDGGVVAVDDATTPGESARFSSFDHLSDFRFQTFDSDGNLIGDEPIDLIVDTTATDLRKFVNSKVQFYQPYELNVVDPTQIVIGTNYMLESSDRGETLTAPGGVIDLNSNTLDDDGDGDIDDGHEWSLDNPVGTVNAMAYGGMIGVTPNADVLYVGTQEGDVLVRSAGNGLPVATTYSAASSAAPVRDIVLDPEDWQTAYAISDASVYETTNAGSVWTEITGNLNTLARTTVETALETVTFVAGALYDLLVVGGQDGVHAMNTSEPGTWFDVGANLPHAPVRDLRYHAADDVLLAGTQGRGAWTVEEASELVTVGGGTGDVIGVDIGTLLSASSYDLVDVEVVGTASTLTIMTEGGTGDLLLEDGSSEIVARAILSQRAEEGGELFEDTGRLYLVPAVDSSLADDDDAVEEGFQGTLRLTFDFFDGTTTRQLVLPVEIAAGYAGSGENAVTINSETLDILRLQHRLNHLGLRRDGSGNTLDLTGTMDAETTSVLKLFQAIVDPQGQHTPGDASGAIGLNSAEWLNDAGAPRWVEYTPLGVATERYGTDWLMEIVDHGITAVPGLGAAGIDVDTISTVDGYGSEPLHAGGPGRLHQVGLEVDFTVPADAQAGGGDGLNVVNEQKLYDLVIEMDTKAEELGLTMVQVVLANTDIIDAINTTIPRRFGAEEDVAVASVGLAADLMQVGFAAATLDSAVGANEGNSMRIIIDKLRELGEALERIGDDALTVTAGMEIPYVSDGLDDVVALGESLQDLADRLLTPAMVTAINTPSGAPLSAEAPVLILLDSPSPTGENPLEVRIPDSGNTTIVDLIADIDTALAAVDLGDGLSLGDLLEAGQVTGGDGDPRLTIAAKQSGTAGFITLTTLRMSADSPGPAYGQLSTDIDFDLEFTLTSLDGSSDTEVSTPVGPVTLELLVAPPDPLDPIQWPYTEDNVTLDDLADDLNDAFRLAVPDPLGDPLDHLGDDLFALVDDGGTPGDTSDDKLVIAARNPNISDVTITGLDPLEEATFGFSNNQTDIEGSMEATSELGFEGARGIAEPRFDTIPELMVVLADELGVAEELLDWQYDTQTDSLLFNLTFSETYSKDVGLDFTDGLSLGPLGTLEFTATADATFEAGVDLDFRVGIFLGELGSGFEITADTLLSELNDGAGVDVLVAVTADVDGPSDGRPAANDTLVIELNGGSGNGGSDHTLSFDIASADITDNFDLFDLVDDINDQLAAEGLTGRIEADVYIQRNNLGDIIGRRITLLGTDPSIRTLRVLDGTFLGFNGDQSGNHDDLLITDGVTDYPVDLDGVETVQDVLDRIDSDSGGAVVAGIASDGQRLRVETVSTDPLVIAAARSLDITSLAGFGLGILGVSEDPDGSDDGVLEGATLHGQSLDDRLFIVEPEPGQSNVNLSLSINAETVDLRAALGLIGFELANVDTPDDVDTDPDPFLINLGLPLSLKDPGTGDDQDGRIMLDELFGADVGSVVDLTSALEDFTADLSGTFALSTDLFDGVYTGELVRFSVGLAEPNDLSSIEFEADGSGFDEAMSQLRELSIEQILTIIRSFIEQLQENSEASVLNAEIPLINKSLNDLITLADQVFDAIDQVIASVDLDAVEEARDHVASAIANLPIPPEDKQDLLEALQSLDGVLAGDLDRLASRLISAAAEVDKFVQAEIGTIGPFDPLEQELADAVEELQALVPSLNTLAQRLEAAVNDNLPAGVAFHFDVVDYDGDPGNGVQNALVIGFTAGDDNLIAETFSPELPTDAFGPVDLDVDVSLYAGGAINLGFGVDLTELIDGDPEQAPFILVKDPDTLDPSLVKTGLELNAGFDAGFSVGVQFGSLDLVDGDAELSLLAAEKETLSVAAGAVTLADTPLNEDERFVIVFDGSDVLPPEDFEISGTTITFVGGSPPSDGTEVTVEYQTATVPGGGVDRAADVNNRATIGVDFDDPDFDITDNAIGAVPLADLFDGGGPSLQIDTNGLVTGSLDVEFLNNSAEDAVTLVAGLDHILDPQITVDEEALVSLLENVEFDLRMIVEGIEALLELLENGLKSEIAGNLPLIGGGLDTAGTFIGDLRTKLVVPFREFLDDVGGNFEEVADSVRTYVWDALGAPGLNIIGDTNGVGGITSDDVLVELDADHFQIVVKLAGEDITTVDFDSGLGGLPLRAEGGVSFGWSYDIDFGVGVDRLSGFYFVVNDPNVTLKPELELDLGVGLAVDTSGDDPIPTSLTLDLFGLELSATDNLVGDQPGTQFAGMLGLDIAGDANHRLPLSDIGQKSFGDIFQASLDVGVSVDLTLEAAVAADFPSVAVDLVAGWDFSIETVSSQIEVDIGEPTVGFENIRLQLGDFLSKYIGPAIETVDEILEPIRPVLDLLTAEIPGVSQLSEMAGRGPVTMIDLAVLVKPEQGEAVRKFVNVVAQIADVVESINAASSGGEVVINFGDLNFGGTENSVDLRDSGWNSEDLSAVFDDAAAGFESLTSQINTSGNMAMGAAVSNLSSEPSSQGLGGLGIELAFLKPQNIFKFLIGQTADVITWDIPRFDLGFEWGQKFRILPVPPISVEIGLNISTFIDLSVGYDTRGLQTGNFVDGFFFGDLESVTSGADIDEFGFGMGVSLAALLDIGVASAGIEGEIRGDVFANWRDTDNNGKMYLDEIANVVSQDGIECLFDLHGAVRAIVRVVWEVLFASGSKDIIDVEIFSFDNEGLCPKFEAAHVSDGTPGDGNRNVLPDGATAPAGTLIVHAGHFAGLRQQGSSTDTSEAFTVSEFAPGVYEVEGMGLTQSFSAVSSIFFDGGKGSDTLDLVGIGAAEVSVPVTAYGGDGADVLEGGTQADLLEGGAGSDVITGYDGSDQIAGDDGDDIIAGGDGNDTITGGRGEDTITAGNGADQLDGGSGEDRIEGEGGPDEILGGAGADEIYGGFMGTPPGGADPDGADTIDGNAGGDTIHGADGGDTIHGGSGHDFIYGEDGPDILYGDSGHDWLDGGDDDDPMIDAGTGNDLLIGGHGKDVLLGNWGNDVILSHLIGDNTSTYGEHIEGGPDDDFICGTDGVDIIFGGTAEVNFGGSLGTGLSHVQDAGDLDDPPAVQVGGYVPVSCLDEPEFVEPPPAVITGQKFRDLDGDGLHDPDEDGLNGWTIEVYDDRGDFVADVLTADSDLSEDGSIDPITESGRYLFDDLDPGTYTVVEILKSSYQQTLPVAGSYELTLDGGETAEGIDFGNRPLASIHGLKWDDVDRDGARDPDEPGVPGVVIYLDLNDDGMRDPEFEPFVLTMEDDEDTPEDETGMFWFEDRVPDTYVVREDLTTMPGYTQTYPAGDSDAHTVELGPGETVVGIDFGNSPPRGDIHGQKFEDRNGNGRRDPGEVGLDDWTIELYEFPVITEEPVRTEVTHSMDLSHDGQIDPQSEQGLFWFVGLDPGTYLVKEVVQPGYQPTTPTEQIVSLVVGQPIDVNFGNRPLPGSIHGTKWDDLDGDAVRDPDEPGIPGVTIYADLNNNGKLDPFEPGQGGEPFAVTMEDSPNTPELDESGMYWLSDLPAGTYTVAELVPSGYGQTYPDPEEGGVHVVVLAPGETREEVDFGNQRVFDFGDAPDPTYPTLIASNGARHSLSLQKPNPTLGRLIDLEPDGRPDGHAMGDDLDNIDDEDGVVFLKALRPNAVGAVQVTVTAAGGLLNTWIDFNRDGDWMDEGEHVFTDLPLGVGVHTLGFSVPADAVPGETFARFRLSTRDGLSFDGPAIDGEVEDYEVRIEAVPAQVLDRYVFYNNSNWDDPALGRSDDDAIAPDKTALLPGQTATFANYTSYLRGINGIMIDVAGLPTPATIGPESFEFRIGNNDFPDTWTLWDADPTVTVRPGEGVGGSDRVTLILPDHDPNSKPHIGGWLQVTLLAGAGTGLAANDVFYFGNAIGESGNSTSDAKVNVQDVLTTRSNPHPFWDSAQIDTDYDYDRDERVDAADILIARANQTWSLTALKLITVPGAKGAAGPEASEFSPALGQAVTSLDSPILSQELHPASSKQHQPCDVHGTKWNDINGDGKRDPGEPGVAGVTIYADLNDNGQLDDGEPFATTIDDDPNTPQDETGEYCLTGLTVPPTDFVIREIVPDGWEQTFPVTRLLVNDFYGTLYDINRDTAQTLLPRTTEQTIVGISRSPNDGLLYGVTVKQRKVIRIDPATGSATLVSTLDIAIAEGDIDFDPTTGILYAVQGSWSGGPSPFLYTIDVATGQTTTIGTIPNAVDPSAMAFDDAGNLFVLDLGVSGRLLMELNKVTGDIIHYVEVGDLLLSAYAGMDFDPATGTLYVVSGHAAALPGLFTLDTNTGATNLIGRTGGDLSGMEFLPDPAHVVQVVPGQTGPPADFGNQKVSVLPDGSDQIHAAGDDDKIYGDNLVSDPTIVSEGDADLIMGEGGKDDIFGQDKDDVLWGADPTIGFGGDSDDFIDGGDDTDEVRQTIDNDQILTNILLTGQGNDTLVSIEKAWITGGASGNTIDASAFTAGPVTLTGEGEADRLLGGTGDDLLEGGDGDDLLLSGGDGSDTIIGGAGGDALQGDDGDDTYLFETAVPFENDTLTESGGALGGVDTLDFSALLAGDGVQVDLTALLIATHTNRQVDTPDPSLFENVIGGQGIDVLVGNANDNVLTGGPNDDSLEGGTGNDSLDGAAGNDTLEGGPDDDLYLFRTASTTEADTITEAAGPAGGVDTVDFSELAAGDPVLVDLSNLLVAQHTNRQVTMTTAEGVENVIGTPGDDTLTDNRFDNLLVGKDGNDAYIFTVPVGPQTDTIDEQPDEGIDTLDFHLISTAVTVDLTAAAPVAFHTDRQVFGPGPDLEDVIGGSAGDDITGNASDNLLRAGPGNDTIRAGAGNDTLLGDDGDDDLRGEADADTYVFNPATLPQNDTITESAVPNDTDTLDFSALPGSDALSVNLANPLIAGHTNRNVNTPNPSLFENAIGGAGNDVLFGNASNNTLEGRDGNDLLDGLDGDDLLVGGAGDDVYRFISAAAAQNDTLEELPGGGTDRLDFSSLPAADPVTVDLSADGEIATHTNRAIHMAAGGPGFNIENVVGGTGNDLITGSAVANYLDGRSGDDTINGGRGDDLLIGALGTNILRGGAGDDTYFFLDGPAATDTLVEDSGAVTDGLASGGGSDTLDFTQINGFVSFDLALTNQVVGGVLTVNLHDSSAPESDYFENVIGTQLAANWLYGNDAGNLLVGGPSPMDLLEGRTGDDVLISRSNIDFLRGGDGNDILLGGDGDNFELLGQGGRDIIVGGTGGDTIDGGDEDDILIDGTTTFGAGTETETIEALEVIRAEWGLTDRTYAQRVADITAGVGRGGAFYLVLGDTVFNDSDSDTLTGGPGEDWFFRNLADDTVTDLEVGEAGAATALSGTGVSPVGWPGGGNTVVAAADIPATSPASLDDPSASAIFGSLGESSPDDSAVVARTPIDWDFLTKIGAADLTPQANLKAPQFEDLRHWATSAAFGLPGNRRVDGSATGRAEADDELPLSMDDELLDLLAAAPFNSGRQ